MKYHTHQAMKQNPHLNPKYVPDWANANIVHLFLNLAKLPVDIQPIPTIPLTSQNTLPVKLTT